MTKVRVFDATLKFVITFLFKVIHSFTTHQNLIEKNRKKDALNLLQNTLFVTTY